MMILTARVAVASAVVLLTGGAAEASLVLALSDGSSHVVVVDQGGVGAVSSDGITSSHGDDDLTIGVVSFSGSVGGFPITVAVGLSKPLLEPQPALNLFSVVLSGGAGTLLVAVTDDAYTLDPVVGEALSLGGTTDGSIRFWSYVDPDDLEFSTNDGRLAGILDGAGVSIERGTGNEQSVHSGPLGPGAFSSGLSIGFSPPIAAPFAMTLVAEVSHSAPFQVSSFTAQQTAPIPEPASIAIWAAGGLILLYRNPKRQRGIWRST